MGIKFIDGADNRAAADADAIEELVDIGIPATVSRDFFVRLGNLGSTLSGIRITVEGDHPDRVQLSFNQYHGYANSLMLDLLSAGKSKNLYVRVTMPTTVKDQDVLSWIVVGDDQLPIRYTAASALNTLFDPYPLYDGEFTEIIFQQFENKPVHRFIRYDPIENVNGVLKAADATGVVKLKDLKLCTYFDPNDHDVGYEQPFAKDLVCIPAPREIESVEEWVATDAALDYGDRSRIFLQPNFLNEMGGEPPIWLPFGTDSISQTELFKRSHFLMLRAGVTYHLEHLRPVMRGQELGYYKAELRVVIIPQADNPKGYNPFAQVYEEDSDRVIRRYNCWNLPRDEDVLDSDSGSGFNPSAIPPPAPTPISLVLTVDYDVSVETASKQEGTAIGLSGSPDRYIVLRFPSWKIPTGSDLQALTLSFNVSTTTVAADSTADLVPISLDPSASVISDLFSDIAGAVAYDSTTKLRSTGDKSLDLPVSAVTDLGLAGDYFSIGIRGDGGAGQAQIAALEHATEAAATLTITYFGGGS